LRRVLAYPEKFNRRPGRAMAGGSGLSLPGAPVVWRLADAVHEPVLYLIKKQNRGKAYASRKGWPDPSAETPREERTNPEHLAIGHNV